MNTKKRITVLTSIITCFILQAEGADKYTDENRPYEFGFSIDGEQHRHEKKDEKGLIQGEFGFITADGVYHVTVYATDEEGRFKILSMKNIRVKPYPTYTAKQTSTSARQGHSLEPPASSQTGPSLITTTLKPISIEPPANSCSHCSLPKTTTPAPILTFNQAVNSLPSQSGASGTPILPQGVKPQSTFNNQPNGNSVFSQQEVKNESPQNFDTQSYLIQPQHKPQSSLESELLPPKDSQSIPQQESFVAGQNAQGGINSPQGSVPSPQDSQSFLQQGFGADQNSPVGPAGQNSLIGINNPQGNLPPLQNAQSFPQQSFGIGQSPRAGFIGISTPGFNTPLQSGLPQQQPQTSGNSPDRPQANVFNGIMGQKFPSSNNVPQIRGGAQYSGETFESGRDNSPSGRTPKRLDNEPSFGQVNRQPNSLQTSLQTSQGSLPLPTKPTLLSAQMQIVDKNTDIHRLAPGENEGLPEGVTKDHVSRLLYTFNYTLGFHGHFEEGYTDGVKQGYYFITGRNGVKTRVDYVADSTGFHPKISQEVLDLLSDDVPKPETEKEEKYGLKGYEFKWLYYPVEAKGR